jgi:dolichol-phosphate mannosyltransferase/undecaprenyl-phosphate 4-deoxy-4-formamido-L-arabinose transferase
MSRRPEYSVVIPCFGSGEWLSHLVNSVSEVLADYSHEVILVNDYSPDDTTWPAIQSLAETMDNVVGIDLAKNAGQFAALMCGLAESRGDLIITMDDDFQHPPEEIPKLIEAMDDETDVVIGSYEEKKHNGLRNMGTRVMDRIFTVTYGKSKGLRMGSFRLLRRRVVDSMLSFGTVRPVPGALILQSTARIKNAPVAHRERERGASGYSLRRLVRSTVDNVVSASVGPLRLISALGLASAGFAVGALIFYLARALFTDRAVPGFSTTVVLITFFGGATLLAIGVVGEYIARVVVDVGRPPLYAIRQRTGHAYSEEPGERD